MILCRLAVVAAVLVPAVAFADEPQCRVLDLSFTPAVASDPANQASPQIVAWLEDAAGNFVDTIYITHETGTFGLGNRPGRFDFNSGPFWPYGRRITVFPVWSHKQPLRWQELVFQDDNDNGLSHSAQQSSGDLHFCRPIRPSEFDAMTCPTAQADTDKGVFSTGTSRYPPRNDLTRAQEDSASVSMFAMLNPFDAVSQPTPASGVDARISYAVPPDLASGDYVLWIEVSKEFDMNGTYNPVAYPSPLVPFGDYGAAYRGQPSVVYKVPFTMTDVESTSATDTYVGYGDPDGLDGQLRAPDSSISSDPGSGGGRLALVSSSGSTYRARVVSRRERDEVAPDAPLHPNISDETGTKATITFLAPGDDFQTGLVKGYEVRYRIGEVITEANFATSTIATTTIAIGDPGVEQTVTIEGLLPETEYSIGIRAFDDCRNTGPMAVVPVTTGERTVGQVDACFIATAAYGSVMANDVELLRGFRDTLLAKTVLGELAIETYYTFGPAIAGVIGESEVLRASARGVLDPFVAWVRAYLGR